MLRELTIQLDTPLKLNEIEIKEITLKEPTAGQMIKVQAYTGFEQNVRLVAAVSGVQPLMVEQMSFTDFKKCVDFFEDVFRDDTPDRAS